MKPQEVDCRLCGAEDGLDAHHIVNRSLKRDDSPANLVLICRLCHDAVHAKKVDLLPVLTYEEQGKAASLIGIERARMLLAPSLTRPFVEVSKAEPWLRTALGK